MKEKKLWFRTICLRNGIQLTDERLDLFDRYATLLLEWNKKINLISRKDEENLWQNHLLHSASIAFMLNLPHHSSVLDIGTGGGLPGIPLKIMDPSLRVTLLDATQKKINAVKEILLSLSINDVPTVWGRAEEHGKSPQLKSKFDLVVARAVAPLRDLVKWSLPFLKMESRMENVQDGIEGEPEKHGVAPPALIALKGGDLEKEIRQVEALKIVKKVDVFNLVFAGSEQMSSGDKKIVVVRF